MPGAVYALARDAVGGIVVGGSSTTFAPVLGAIARWNGTTFTAVGTLPPGFFSAWFDGSSWRAFGAGLLGTVLDLTVLPNGDVVAVGILALPTGVPSLSVARWDGTAWQSVGSGLPTFIARATVALQNGNLLVGGTNFGAPNVMQWDGAAWTGFGSGSGPSGMVHRLEVEPDGSVIVIGSFDFVSGQQVANIARWNGQWSSVGGGIHGPVYHTHRNGQGDLVACGIFTAAGGIPAGGVARWNGINWSSLGASTFANAGVSLPNGDVSTPNGCAGSGGNNLLQVSGLWIGSSATETGTGLPMTAFVIAARGVTTTSVSLAQLLPAGIAGCLLGVAPVALELMLTTDGTASSSYALPNNPGLVGLTLVSQWVMLEHNPGFDIVAATSSNTVIQVVGSF